MTTLTPKVSVVCAWYNRADYIRETLDSLLLQDFDDFEIILINDGSSDPKVRNIISEFDDPRLRIFHQENVGFTESIRRAVSLSKAPYVAIMGAGDISEPSRLRKQLDALEKDETICAVGCRIRNTVVTDRSIGEEAIAGLTKSRWSVKDLLGLNNMFSHGEVMFRRDIYEHVGGYRSFFKFAQDRDLWLRMGEHGDFFVLDEQLYRRRIFTKDGVAENLHSSLMQRRLSTLAIQCFHERSESGTDCVEQFGHLAGLLRKPSSVMSNAASLRSIKEFQLGNLENMRYLLKIATLEGATFTTRVAQGFYHIGKIPGGRSAIIYALKVLRKFRRMYD